MNDVPALPEVAVLAAPLYLGLIALEVVLVRRGRARGAYETRDAFTSLLMGVASVVTGALYVGALAGLAWVAWEHRLADLGFGLPALALAFVLYDHQFYWTHRLGHRSRWFWARHVIHHSSQHFNLSTALRQPWTSPLGLLLLLELPLVFLGFHPVVVAFVASLNLVYQFWIHTETIGRLPAWFEAIFNTPSHHRVHHGRNPRYLDANYAGTFIVWDRLYGTFVPECDEDPVRYGLTHNLGTMNPLRVAFHEFVAIARDVTRRGLSVRERLAYLFAPPGWSHDGSRQGSRAVKAEYVERHPELAGTPGFPHAAAPTAPTVASEMH